MSRHLAFCVVVLLAAGASRAAGGEETPAALGAQDLAATFAALDLPTVSGQLDAPAELRIGRAEIRPASGSKLLVLSAQGRVCGFVLDGPAHFSYRVEDRFSIPLASRNLKRASGLEVTRAGDTLTATGALKGMAVWGWDLELPAGAAPAPPGAGLPGWLTVVLEGKLDASPARDMLLSAWNADGGYRWAVLRGTGDDFALAVDPRAAVRQEKLARWYKLPSLVDGYAGRLIAEELATQPTSGAWWDPPAMEFVTVDTDLKLVNDTGEHAVITTRLQVKSFREGLRLLALRLVRVLYDEGRRRELKVTRLEVDGEAARYYHHGRGDLLVALPHALAANQSARLEVAAEGNILLRPAGDNYWALGVFSWYPKPAATGEEWSAFRIDVESRAPFVPLPAGETVTSEKPGANRKAIACSSRGCART